jgi:hypothetical protein
MEDLNKITSTRVGDNIHFFVNGAEDKGTVVKMDSQFVTVVKDDGNFQDIHINDTFFIKDIIVNKSWNDMTMEERTVELHKVHAYSPRFLGKAWEDLPQSLKDVMKSNVEQGHLGGGGRSSQVVETSTAFDAEEDYEGESHDTKEEQFKHDNEKPKVTNKTMQEQLWEEWLNKESHSVGDGGSPAKTSSNNSSQTNDSGMYNPVYGEKGRHGGQGRDKEEEDKEEDKERKG